MPYGIVLAWIVAASHCEFFHKFELAINLQGLYIPLVGVGCAWRLGAPVVFEKRHGRVS
jgi:hypothetical protein